MVSINPSNRTVTNSDRYFGNSHGGEDSFSFGELVAIFLKLFKLLRLCDEFINLSGHINTHM